MTQNVYVWGKSHKYILRAMYVFREADYPVQDKRCPSFIFS